MKLLFVAGTRPEMIKLAPVIHEAKKYFDTELIITGQHPMVERMVGAFGLSYTYNLLMPEHMQLNEMTEFILRNLGHQVCDVLVVQGDTTSSMAAALWAFNQQIPVVHIEAGLRTYDKDDPYPEEVNRRIIDSISTYHYAPTEVSLNNILRERCYVSRATVPMNAQVVGNTVIDALNMIDVLPTKFEKPTVIFTAHRRESWGLPVIQTVQGVLDWLETTDRQVLWPVHPNSALQGVSMQIKHPKLVKREAMEYTEFLAALKGCDFVVTDSGGIQEEAAALGKYALVVRKHTERQEGIDEGVATLVQPGRETVFEALKQAETKYEEISATQVYGDGKTAERIIEHLRVCLEKSG